MHYTIVYRTPYNRNEIFTSKHRTKFFTRLYAKYLIKCGFKVLVYLKVND